MTTRFIVDGHEVFATTGGVAFDPARPVVVFLHGAGFDRTVWRLQTRWFANHGRSVLAVDMPGHGRSGGTPLNSIADMADWTIRLLDAAGVRQAALVGHSMGGLVALDAAGRYPDRVRALGLCGIAGEMPVHPEMLESAKAGTAKVRELMTFWGLGRAHQIGGMVSPGLWLTRESLAVLDKAAPGVIHNDLAACNAYKDAPVRAAAVKCPAAFVCGDIDQMTPSAKCKPLVGVIPGSAMTVLKACGHFMMVERPDETLDALKAVA